METCRIDRIGLAAQDWLVPAPEKIVVTSANQESEDGREEGSRMSEHLSEEEKTSRAYSLARIDENNIRPTTGITIRLTKITLDQTSTRDSRLSRAQRPQTAGYIWVYHTKVLLDKSIIDKSIIQYYSDKSITRQKYYSELKPTNT